MKVDPALHTNRAVCLVILIVYLVSVVFACVWDISQHYNSILNVLL